MVPIRISANIGGGKIVPCPTDVQTLIDWLKANNNAPVELVLCAPQSHKTKQQLGYLWGHVIPQIASHIGYSKDEVYRLLCYKFLRSPIHIDDETLFVIRTLSELTKQEVSTFIDDAVEWGLGLGADIYPAQVYGGA